MMLIELLILKEHLNFDIFKDISEQPLHVQM